MNKYLRMEVGPPVDDDMGYPIIVGYGITPEGREFKVISPTMNCFLEHAERLEPQVRELIENWVPGWRPIL